MFVAASLFMLIFKICAFIYCHLVQKPMLKIFVSYLHHWKCVLDFLNLNFSSVLVNKNLEVPAFLEAYTWQAPTFQSYTENFIPYEIV